MRAIVQRVTHAAVTVLHPDRTEEQDERTGEIGPGLLVYLGIADGDTHAEATLIARKIAELRIFDDADGRMNLALTDLPQAHAGAPTVLLVSQFTLYADTRKGRRPSFTDAAPPDLAEPLIDAVATALETHGLHVATGRFRTHMRVESTNDGPVTIPLDTDDLARPRRG